jgi:hypothetical protein
MKKINFLALIFPFLTKRRIILMRLQLFRLEREIKEVPLQDTWLEAAVKFFQIARHFNEKKGLKRAITWLSRIPNRDPDFAFQLNALERLNSNLQLAGRAPGSTAITLPEGKINEGNLLIGGYGLGQHSVSYWLKDRELWENKVMTDDFFLNGTATGDPFTVWQLINDHVAGDLIRDRVHDILYRIALIKKFGGEIE